MPLNRRPKNLNILLLAAIAVLVISEQAQAYIGPGAGFTVGASLLAMFVAVLSAAVALISWPIRYAIRAIRYRHAFARSRVKRFVVLGLDGLDPKMTEKLLAQGKLPNLAKLRDQGCFKTLASTIPPISPVAWSSFQTGVNPGKHNIFDFLTRDKHSYVPKLSSVDIREPRRSISLGKYQFPLGKSDIRMLRKGKPFWKSLGEHGIFSTVIRVPITFPPEKFPGVQLSAMCVPDLRGTQGMFSFYTTATQGKDDHTGGQRFCVTQEANKIKSALIGAENPLRKDKSVLECPFVITILDDISANIKINGQTYALKKDQYSEWIKVQFKAGLGMKVRGICKFLLLRTKPHFELYVTPINIDPEKPVMPIAHPGIYSTYLAKRQGSYATLGLAEDSWALNEEILSDEAFLQQCLDTDHEREKMFFDALDKVKHGLCVCVFDGTDRIQHTFWRYLDQQHPAYKKVTQEKVQHAIEGVYQRMDDIVGKAMRHCDTPKNVLMVISDHGFATFRYGVDLNRWLEINGYLKLKDGPRDKDYLAGVDWSQTRAFAIGLTGVFLNIKGRESQGIVIPGDEAAALSQEIAEKLTGLTDSDRSAQAIKQVYISENIYRGPYKDEAPNLIVGYHRGYRASWETAIGKITEDVFHANTKAWSGDHCIDSSLVPGVLFCNRPIDSEHARLLDIGPTVLDMFGVSVPANMDGRPLALADEPDRKASD